MDNHKKGDIVQLKSGGPHMTINFIYNENKADCIWFDEHNELICQSFFLHVLKII